MVEFGVIWAAVPIFARQPSTAAVFTPAQPKMTFFQKSAQLWVGPRARIKRIYSL